jgi:hypothetical protein
MGRGSYPTARPAANHQLLTGGAQPDHVPRIPTTRTGHGHRPSPLCPAPPRHAAAAALSRLRQHREARAEAGADPVRADAVGSDRAGVRGWLGRARRRRSDDATQGRAVGRADDPGRAGARRGRTAGAGHADRAVAVQLGRALPPPGRPARRAARPQFHWRRPNRHQCRGRLPLSDDQARRLSLAQQPECVAAGAYPSRGVRSGLCDAAQHADVFPGRPAARLRPDLSEHRRHGGARAADRAIRPGAQRSRMGGRLPLGHRVARPRRDPAGPGVRRGRWPTS